MTTTLEQQTEDRRALMERYLDRGQTDGWPVVPPSRRAVEAMIAASGRSGDEILGEFAYRASPVRLQDVAANAVMAGCLPEHMPVVLAAFEILIDRSFNTQGWGASTNSFLPWIVLNGPIRRTLGINCRDGMLGPGTPANATIGRAIRLSLINLAGESIRQRDCGTMGNPYKFTCCFGEDEEDLGWSPLHTEAGFPAEASTVTIMVSRHPRHVTHTASHRPEQILGALADELGTLGAMGAPVMRPVEGEEPRGRARALVVLGAGHRRDLRAAGWDKRRVREFLLEATIRHRDGTRAYRSPEDIVLVGAGGAGPSSLAINVNSVVTRAILAGARAPSGEAAPDLAHDGLPRMPVTRAALTAAAATAPAASDDIVTSALEAGCLPEHMPVVAAALEALRAIFVTSLEGDADLFPIVIVHGPIRRALGLNSGRGAFGPGTRANAAIGRAIGLCLRRPDRPAGLGSPYWYTAGVVAEAEESSPWPALHTELGFHADESAVTALLCAHARQTTNMETAEPEPILRTLADDMSTPQSYDLASDEAGFLVALCEDFRSYLGRGGWSRRAVQELLASAVGLRAGYVRARGYPLDARWHDDDVVPLARPERFLVAAIGGGGGHSLTARFLRRATVPIAERP